MACRFAASALLYGIPTAIAIPDLEEMELLVGGKVYLDLRVKVMKEWQRDPRQLRKLGF